ncbi:MAG: HAMP domain-containing protein, partial [Methylococcaceae bacterium]|nr:HAMP domain-containing protein [Methylococcaceae bacterium]
MPTRRRHLHHKLARAVFWGTTLLAALISAAFWVSELKRSTDKTVVMLNQLLDTVESTAAIAAYSGNGQIAEDVLEGLLRNDIVHRAQISNGQGLELSQARNTEVPRHEPVVRTLHSPFADDEEVGRLTVVPEARFTLQEARHAAVTGALNSVTLIAITALLVVGLVRSLLTVPLARVSARLHEINAGEADRLNPLPRHGDDELGQLVSDINGLLDTLEEKFVAERQLREDVQGMERKLRNIFETTSAGIFQLDRQGVLLTANPSLGRVLRWPAGQPVERSGADFLAIAFDDPARMHDLIKQAEQQDQPVSADLMLNREELGEAVWVHCVLSHQT